MMRRVKRCFLALLIITVFTLTGCQPGAGKAFKQSEHLKVHFLDVGQADCMLVESDGHFMLIDAGNRDDEEVVMEYLNKKGVTELDFVIGTHPHEDHIGSLGAVIDSFPIETLIMPKVSHTTETFKRVVTAVENRKLTITAPVSGKSYSLGSAVFTIIAPLDQESEIAKEDLNNHSVGIRLVHGKNSFLLCGDAEKEEEQEMLHGNRVVSADVLKASHHGSDTSTSELFYKEVSPKTVVISVGEGNDYGHPHVSTLDRIRESGAKVYRTDENGTIISSSDGETIRWDLEKTQKETKTEKDNTSDIKPVTSNSYIMNTSTEKFHTLSCRSVAQMKAKNKEVFEGKREELIIQGYAPCKICSP